MNGENRPILEQLTIVDTFNITMNVWKRTDQKEKYLYELQIFELGNCEM